MNRVSPLQASQAPPWLDVEHHDGADFHAVFSIYEKAALFTTDMLANVEVERHAMAENWRRLHDPSAHLAYTFLFGRTAEPASGTLSTVRAWDETWLVQHFVVLPSAPWNASIVLQQAWSEAVLPRATSSSYAAFIVKTHGGQSTHFERFARFAGTSARAIRVPIARWLRAKDLQTPSELPRDHHLGPLEPADEPLVARAAERIMGADVARALSLSPGHFALGETSQRFQGAGLERRRAAFLLSNRDGPVAALFKERTSPGMNLSGVLDGSWYIPISPHASCNATTAALFQREPFISVERKEWLMIPGDESINGLAEAGFTPAEDVYLYILNRTNLTLYFEYLAHRSATIAERLWRRVARPEGDPR